MSQTKQGKYFKLSSDDLAKLAAVRQYRDCPSDVEAIRHCIRETYRMDVDRVSDSFAIREYLGAADYEKFMQSYGKVKQ